jgi:hypothetical protein
MAKMYKVISAVEKDGKTKFWMRLGTAFLNRDNSINVYLDAVPRSMQLQIREFDERDRKGNADREDGAPIEGAPFTEQLPLASRSDRPLLADAPF